MRIKAIWSITTALTTLPMVAHSQAATGPVPATDPTVTQLRVAEMEAIEAGKKGVGMPAREVRRQSSDATQGRKKAPKKRP